MKQYNGFQPTQNSNVAFCISAQKLGRSLAQIASAGRGTAGTISKLSKQQNEWNHSAYLRS